MAIFTINDGEGFWPEDPLKKIGTAARSGNIYAQFAAASIAMLDTTAAKILGLSCDERVRMELSSALGGLDEAQYLLSLRLSGSYDSSAPQLSLAWLSNSATTYAPAQLQMSMQLLDRADAAQHSAEIRSLLIAAATGKNDYVRKRSAFLLSTMSLVDAREPQMALTIAMDLLAKDPDNAEFAVILASAEAASGHFPEAIKAQQRAIKNAQRLGWDVRPLQEMLTAYKANRLPDFSGYYLSWSDEHLKYRSPYLR
jgi:tetratricopeptide (TPR) repeat protein